MERKRITAVHRRLNGSPIYFFPYCSTGKKGMVKAFYNGTLINVNYRDALQKCDKVWEGIDQYNTDKAMMDSQLHALGINVRVIRKASSKLGIMEKLFIGRVYEQ